MTYTVALLNSALLIVCNFTLQNACKLIYDSIRLQNNKETPQETRLLLHTVNYISSKSAKKINNKRKHLTLQTKIAIVNKLQIWSSNLFLPNCTGRFFLFCTIFQFMMLIVKLLLNSKTFFQCWLLMTRTRGVQCVCLLYGLVNHGTAFLKHAHLLMHSVYCQVYFFIFVEVRYVFSKELF